MSTGWLYWVKCNVIERWLSKLFKHAGRKEGRKEGRDGGYWLSTPSTMTVISGWNTFHQNAIKHAEFCIIKEEEENKIGWTSTAAAFISTSSCTVNIILIACTLLCHDLLVLVLFRDSTYSMHNWLVMYRHIMRNWLVMYKNIMRTWLVMYKHIRPCVNITSQVQYGQCLQSFVTH